MESNVSIVTGWATGGRGQEGPAQNTCASPWSADACSWLIFKLLCKARTSSWSLTTSAELSAALPCASLHSILTTLHQDSESVAPGILRLAVVLSTDFPLIFASGSLGCNHFLTKNSCWEVHRLSLEHDEAVPCVIFGSQQTDFKHWIVDSFSCQACTRQLQSQNFAYPNILTSCPNCWWDIRSHPESLSRYSFLANCHSRASVSSRTDTEAL